MSFRCSRAFLATAVALATTACASGSQAHPPEPEVTPNGTVTPALIQWSGVVPGDPAAGRQRRRAARPQQRDGPRRAHIERAKRAPRPHHAHRRRQHIGVLSLGDRRRPLRIAGASAAHGQSIPGHFDEQRPWPARCPGAARAADVRYVPRRRVLDERAGSGGRDDLREFAVRASNVMSSRGAGEDCGVRRW